MKFNRPSIFAAVVVLVAAWAVLVVSDLPFGAGLYPRLVGGMTFLLALAVLIGEIRQMRSGIARETGVGSSMDLEVADEPARQRYGGFARAMGWMLGMCLSIGLLGWQIGLTVFFTLYLVFQARARWFVIPILAALMMLILFYFDQLLEVFWPEGFLIELLDLPFF